MDRELGVSELSRRLGVSKSTVHRLVVTLTSEGLLQQDPLSGKYRLGIAMHDLGAAVSTRLDLHEAVIPPMRDFAMSPVRRCTLRCSTGVRSCPWSVSTRR